MTASTATALSFAQEQIWVAEQLAPDVSVYGIPMVIRLRGAFDTGLAARCVAEIVRRHEILRSRVTDAGGRLLLVLDPPAVFEVPVLDLRSSPGQWRDLLEASAREPFDLARETPLRVRVLRVADDGYVLFLNLHHLAADGWSLGLFWHEFTTLYTAWHGGTEPVLPDLPRQYRDFAEEQRGTADSGGYRDMLAAWTRGLEGAPATLDLPVDHGPGTRGAGRGAKLRVVVPEELRAEAYACARRLGVTPFAMLGAAWGAVLARWTRQDDVLIGTPLAGRTRLADERLIGLFVNTMPLRLRPRPETPFADLAREFQMTAFDALSRQEAPATELLGMVRAGRPSHDTPLFQSMYSFEERMEFGAALPGCAVTDLFELSNGGTTGPGVNLGAMDAVGELSLAFNYDAHLFDAGTIEAMADCFLALLGDASRDPRVRIGELRTAVAAAPDPKVAGNPGYAHVTSTLDALFEQRVRQSPDAPAIELEDGSRVSYAQLNSRANRLARSLLERGLRAGDRVALAFGRRSAYPVAVLAVLKAGAAYVPLAPGAPGDRNDHVLAETAPRFVLTTAELAGAFGGAGQVIALDDPVTAAGIGAQSGANPPPAGVTGAHVAYVPFTSGSTGRPKGTLVTHANLVAFTLAAVETFGLGPADRMLQIAAMTFDVHVEEFFPTWRAGGCVVFFDGELARTTPESLFRLWGERAITICELPTAYWAELARSVDPATVVPPRSMRRLLIGGERAPLAVSARWRGFGIPLTNVYGLTETAVTSTTFDVGDGGDRPALPVGRPMPHAAVYVLDDRLAPVGRGVPGEIFLGGPGISAGLLNQPAQTAGRFLPDPFADEPGARMYRTGDYGRWTASDDLEFLGRADRQLKVRGHRVELAEIEAALEGHADVERAVVVPRRDADDPAAGIELNAFVTGPDAGTVDLVAHLRTRLPSHMVPAQVTVLPQFPLTPHGKVDEAALLELRAPEPVSGGTPLDAFEAEVAEIYRTVLARAEVDPRLDVFALGFHSLTALRLMARLKHAFAVELPVVDFLKDSSVMNAARLIRRARTGSEGT